MKILLTGSEGFTGKYLSNYLNNSNEYKLYKLKSNLLDSNSLNEEIKIIKPNYVVHLGAISYVDNSNLIDFYKVNLIGTINLLNICEKYKELIKKIIIVSSANVYGNNTSPPITEEAIYDPQNHYAMSKVSMELMTKKFAKTLPIIWTRPFNYIGAGQNIKFLIPKIAYHFAKKKECELGNIDVSREFNCVEFVVKAYIELIKSDISNEIINICSGEHYSIKDIIDYYKKISNTSILIKIADKLKRKDEVNKLYGSPLKLEKFIGKVKQPNIETRLRKIYEFYTKN